MNQTTPETTMALAPTEIASMRRIHLGRHQLFYKRQVSVDSIAYLTELADDPNVGNRELAESMVDVIRKKPAKRSELKNGLEQLCRKEAMRERLRRKAEAKKN